MFYYGLEWQSLDTYFQYKEIEEPPTPQANEIRQYATDASGISTICWKNDAGAVICLPTTSGILALASSSGMQIGGTITSATEGSVLFAGAAGVLAQDNANFFWADSINRLSLGSAGLGHTTGSLLSLESVTGDAAFESTTHFTGAVNEMRFRKSRGNSHTSPTSVVDGDTILVLAGHGHDGSNFILSSWIQFAIDGTPGTNDMPGRIVFYTTTDGGAVAPERFRISNFGGWGIGGATFGTAGDVFTSGGAAAAPTWSTHPGGGVNFGPAAVASITVVNGHITAIS